MILAAQSEAFKQENVLAERLHGLDQQMERKGDESLYFMDQIWVLFVGSVMDEVHESSKEWNSGDDQLRLRWMIYLVVLADDAESIRDTIGFDYHLSIWCALFEALYGMKCRSPVLWAEIGESSLIGPELKPLEFEVGDRVMLKVSPWKGDIRFGKRIEVDKTLRFVEEPIENSDCEVMRLICSRMVIVKDSVLVEARSLGSSVARRVAMKLLRNFKVFESLAMTVRLVQVAFDLLRDALSAIFGLSELKSNCEYSGYYGHVNTGRTDIQRGQVQAMVDFSGIELLADAAISSLVDDNADHVKDLSLLKEHVNQSVTPPKLGRSGMCFRERYFKTPKCPSHERTTSKCPFEKYS
ncbi:hypothetical protein Tco_0499299 [Tanacetum coccineum]